MELTIIAGEPARDTAEVLPLCLEVFEDFSPSYLTERLQRVTDPVLVCTRLPSRPSENDAVTSGKVAL